MKAPTAEGRLWHAELGDGGTLWDVAPICAFLVERTGTIGTHRPTGYRLRRWLRRDVFDTYCAECREDWPCRPVRLRAAAYSEHPDYRKEWKP